MKLNFDFFKLTHRLECSELILVSSMTIGSVTLFVNAGSTDLFSCDLKAESKRRPSVVRERLASLLVMCYTLLSFNGIGFLGFR